MAAPYRILSLDGGGTWAVLEVMALIDIYGPDARGLAVLGEFDLVAANSGGSIVLGGLLMNWKLSEVLALYQQESVRKSLFVKTHVWETPLSKLLNALFGFGCKYSTEKKLIGLRALLGSLGDVRLPDLRTLFNGKPGKAPHFLICAYYYDKRRAAFPRSNMTSAAASAPAVMAPTLAEAINASSTAPVNYFDDPALIDKGRYWDGAIGGYNNPVLAALIEAVRDGKHLSDIQILSLGTANVRLPVATGAAGEDSLLVRKLEKSTLVGDVVKLSLAILDDPPDAATYHAHVMLAASDVMPTLIRMNPLIQPAKGTGNLPWTLPLGLTRPEFKRLIALDMDAIEQDEMELIIHLGNVWLKDLVQNQPIQANGDTFAATIPYDTYSAAKAAWLGLRARGGSVEDVQDIA